MSWIKRNLYFVLGSLAALALMGLAGYYIYSRWHLNAEMGGKLSTASDTLKGLKERQPNPGSPGKVDNLKMAQEQRQQLVDFINKATNHFTGIPPIPDSRNASAKDFADALSQTTNRLQIDAAAASVSLPPKYNFSFEAEGGKFNFARGSLGPLSLQLGGVKAICDILIGAKVNSLDGVRRERVAAEDATGPETDYVSKGSQTNSLAVLTPYEVNFRCFGPELAAVLAGFAKSPYGFIVKRLSVEPASASAAGGPAAVSLAALAAASDGAEAAVPAAVRGGPPPRMPPSSGARAPSGRGGPQTMLNERQLKVTMELVLVKLLPSK